MTNCKKNILIVGNSAVSSALAKKLAKNESCGNIFVAPGNGIHSEIYKNVDIRENNVTELLKFVLENDINLTIPISDKALNSDIVSFFQSNGQNIFGPLKDACEIALNKASGKKFLYKIHAQTSRFGIFEKPQQTQEWLNSAKFPIIIRCCENNKVEDRLVATTMDLAIKFIENLFVRNESNILLEEYTYGHNFTIYYMTDGYSALPFSVVANYKFSSDGDGGFYTNGCGCYLPDYKVSDVVITRVNNIVKNTISTLAKRNIPYVGILGIDCTITGEDKFYVNEFRPFLQDFDCAAILNSVDDDLFELFNACIEGLFADEYEKIKVNDNASVSVVVNSRSCGCEIKGIDLIEDIENVDFCYVTKTNNDKYLTLAKNAFILTRSASTLSRAKQYLYDDLGVIDFNGIKYRKDIGS